jgi:selenocysteine lyase/cysteine desulfurase
LEAGGDPVQRSFDVRSVREPFPALRRTHNGRSVAYFDGPGGSQVAKPAIEAMSNYMERGGANLHDALPTSTEEVEEFVESLKCFTTRE